MNILKKTTLLILSILCLQACKQEPAQPDSLLKGFMLAGPYIVKSYGGKSAIEKYMGYSRKSNEEETIALHKKTWIFYFTETESKMAAETLSNYWDITDKTSLTEILNGLRDEPYAYKSWDYARLVNNATLGYAAGYLTKEEAQAYIEATLAKAQEKYADWDSYFKDFNAGRKEWNPDSPDLNEFSRLVTAIQKDDNSVYRFMPLQD